MKALFYAYFDETKGQTLKHWLGDLSPGHIEQTVLPSGLHHVDRDVVVFRHHGRLGIGLFTSVETSEGRGKRMGTVGMIPDTEDDILQWTDFLCHVDHDHLDEYWQKEVGKPSEVDLSGVLEMFGPLIVPIIRAAKAGKRIVSVPKLG
jgi:hypothetical protein